MKSSSKYRGLIAKRLSFSMAVYYLLISVLIMRLGYIQIVNPEKYTDKAIVQQQKDEIIQPLRGSILDRNGKELAVSIVTYDNSLRRYMSRTCRRPQRRFQRRLRM